MPSVNMIWNGRCADRVTQEALAAKLRGLARVASGDRHECVVEIHDEALRGRILVGQSALDGEAGPAGLEPVAGFAPRPAPPIQLNVVGAPRRPEIAEALYTVAEAAVTGIAFTLFDARRLYPDDSRVSFVFARSPGCPALDGQLVLVDGAAECARHEGTPVAAADWYLTRPRIHLRYFAERWMDLLLAWVKRFYVADLAWWRHGDMTGWEDFVVLTATLQASLAREAALEALAALFRREVSAAAPHRGAGGPLLEEMAGYLAAGEP